MFFEIVATFSHGDYMLCRLFIILCSCFSMPLSAKLEDHFKTAPHKEGNHQIRNVDFIYMINLDKRPEKFAASLQQLQTYGIEPYRFSAVNGWELSLEDINDVGVVYKQGMTTDLKGTYYPLNGDGQPIHEIMSVPGRTYFCHCMSRGAIGCALSHLSVLKDAFDSGYKTVWIMEDDILIVKNPREVSNLIDLLDKQVGKSGWDMLFTDQDTIDNVTGQYIPCFSYARRPNFTPNDPGRISSRTDVGKEFRRIGARYGMYSFIIRRSGMQKILTFISQHKIFLPIDMEFYFPDHMRIYTVRKDVVSTQRFAPSDNGGPNYETKKGDLP
jgi:GR25 family glycosyltransferase involved in LPS biosynthesis